jgi:hypothetical protein
MQGVSGLRITDMALTRTRRWWLLAEMLLLGLPATLAFLAVFAAFFSTALIYQPPISGMGADYPGGRSPFSAIIMMMVLMLLGLAGVIGLWRIAITAFKERSLREIGMSWWLMLKTGMLLAIVFGVIMWIDLPNTSFGNLLQLFLMGPALLIPAIHLLIERRFD